MVATLGINGVSLTAGTGSKMTFNNLPFLIDILSQSSVSGSKCSYTVDCRHL